MVCEYYCENGKRCARGMPLSPLYRSLVCERKPQRCPVFSFATDYLLECP